ncbi:hypothetical protein TNCV_2796451 [Trichonephila clavipes]|nr:hypothetical protein TNCV_2796451 [Trichonephila clavipes]
MKRLCDARPSNIQQLMDRMKLLVSKLDLHSVNIQERNILLSSNLGICYVPTISTLFLRTLKPLTSVFFQRIYTYHHNQYSGYSAIFTDGSKQAG